MMQIATRNVTHDYHSHSNKAQITVKQGEIFQVETELCTGGWLLSKEDVWTPDKSCALNPTVVVAVEDAKPGDLLAVKIIDILPDSIGYTGFTNKSNPLADKILPRDWGENVKTVEIKDNYIHWSEKLCLPIVPMIGTLGTAPKAEILSNAKAGTHGGNMDVQEVAPGSIVYLPIEVEGALLHIGDVHAIQGDGEINCSGGIECRSLTTLSVSIISRPKNFHCVRIENADYIMAVGTERSLEESFYAAVKELIDWMVTEYDFVLEEAYLLLGQVMEARCTQFVNPTNSYICKIAKKYIAGK